MNNPWIESKKIIRFKEKSENLLREQINEQFNSLKDEEKEDLNIMARWEFAKPVHLRIPKNILIQYFIDSRKKMKKLTTLILLLLAFTGYSQIKYDYKNTVKYYLQVDGEILTDSYNKDAVNALQTLKNYDELHPETDNKIVAIGFLDSEYSGNRVKDTVHIKTPPIIFRDTIFARNTENILIPTKNIFDASLLQYKVAAAGRDRSGKQKITGGKRYYVTLKEYPTSVFGPVGALSRFYDKDGNSIGWNISLEPDKSFIAPENAAFVEMDFNHGNFSPLMQLIEADDLVTPIVLNGSRAITTGKVLDNLKVNVIDADLRKIYLPLLGKKWVLMGDSITQQAKYVAPTQKTTGLTVHTNLGIGGSLIGGIANNLTQQMVDEADVFTVLAGTNNYGLSPKPLGSITDDSTVDSFYGRMRLDLEMIYNLIDSSTLSNEEKAKKLVVFITPTMRGTAQGYRPPEPGAGGKTLLQIRNAIIDICAEFGTPVFDAYTLSGINQINFIGDQLHPVDEQSIYGISLGKFLNLNYKGY